MASLSLNQEAFLKNSFFHRQWGDEMIGRWASSFMLSHEDWQVCWSFEIETASFELPKGYFDSVSQRYDLANALPIAGSLLRSFERKDAGSYQLIAQLIEGEPLPYYVERLKPSLRTSLGLLSDIVSQLREFEATPRSLSNLSATDFLVRSRHGTAVEAKAHPVFSVLREEVSKSDFEIACFWGDYIARMYGAAKDGWSKSVSEYDPAAQRTFRKLLKKMRSGKEMGMTDALEELGRCLRWEMDSLRPPLDLSLEVASSPMGPLRSFLMDEFSMEYPEKLSDDNLQISLGSPFIIPMTSEGQQNGALHGILLPPEGWFVDSLIQGINRKMAIPFLSEHPNSLRTRSLLCEENFTLVVTDQRTAIPLPSLFEIKGGMETEDALRFARKIRRALDQFDSAEFHFEIASPWQVEIVLLGDNEEGDWRSLVNNACSEWPVWDVRIRVEIPTEAVLESSERTAWNYLMNKMNGKSFPALVVWLLEWRRLEWAAKQGALDREPISWDMRFDSLFNAASDYFEPNNASHRERLLSLLEEGYHAEVPS